MKKNVKSTLYAEILFVLGLLLISMGITLMVHADLGISVASSVPYVISQRFTSLSFGTWSYIVQGFLVLLLVLIIRKVKRSYFLSFLVSVVFGVLVDLFSLWTAGLADGDWLLRSILFFMGLFLMSLGIASFVGSNLPLLPYDLFVKELAIHTNISFRMSKTLFDLSCLTLSVLFLLFFVERWTGIGIGSVFSALLNGVLSGLWLSLIQKHFIVRPLFVRFPGSKAS